MHFTIHQNTDGHSGLESDWILRLHDGTGQYIGIGLLNGEEEAKAIYAVLQGAIELDATCSELVYRSDDMATRSFWQGMRQANKQLELHKVRALMPMKA